MVTAYIALGSNLDDPARRVGAARSAIASVCKTKVVLTSSLYLTKPIDASGDDYVNAVVKIETGLGAYELLAELQKLEILAGRVSPLERAHLHNAPRTLDLDILLYGVARIDSKILTVPHPRMYDRAFVLMPLHEIAPELISAKQLAFVANQTVKRLSV